MVIVVIVIAGVPLLPSRSVGYGLARGLDAAGRPQGRSRKAVAPTPQPEVTALYPFPLGTTAPPLSLPFYRVSLLHELNEVFLF